MIFAPRSSAQSRRWQSTNPAWLNSIFLFGGEFFDETAFANFVHQSYVHEIFGLGAARLRRGQRIDDVLNTARLRGRKIADRFDQPLVKRAGLGIAVALAENRTRHVWFVFESVDSFDDGLQKFLDVVPLGF